MGKPWLPKEMTPELIELAEWLDCTDVAEDCDLTDSYAVATHPAAGVMPIPDLTTWRTYGVLFGALVTRRPQAWLWFGTASAPAVCGVAGLCVGQASYSDPRFHGDTAIEAIAKTLRFLIEQEERDDA
jgi:hypothetical protein